VDSICGSDSSNSLKSWFETDGTPDPEEGPMLKRRVVVLDEEDRD